MAVATKVPHLLGGVSQLPHEQRHPSTVDILENALVSKEYGLRKRPPTETIGTISSTQTGFDSAFLYAIDRKDDERYVAVVANGDLKVFDAFTGAEQVVTFPDGKDYLAGGAEGFRAFTVGDHTFLVNRSTTVRRGSTKADAQVNEALIFVRQGDYSTTYTVTLDGEEVSIATAAEGAPDARSKIATDVIAADIYTALTTQTTKVWSEFEFQLLGSTIHLHRVDWGDFKLTSSDGLADKGLRIIKGKVESLEDLPAKARDGMVVEVVGDAGSAKDNTWVRYEDTGDTEGLWRECPKPGVLLDFDASTMPHELVRQGRLTPPLAAAGIPRQPTVLASPTTEYKTGWTKDGSDVVINSDETKSVECDASGEAIRSPAVLGSHASLTRQVVIGFDLDASKALAGTQATVALRADTGGGWSTLDSRTYTAGALYLDQKFSRRMVVPAGTRFELGLTLKNVFGVAPSTSRRVRLIGHGTANTLPGVSVTELPSTSVYLGKQDDVFPKGMTVSLTIEGVSFSTTLTADRTTAQLAQDLATLVDAHGSLVATYTAPTDWFLWGSLLGFEVSTATGGAAAVTAASFAFDDTKLFWSPEGTMTAGEHVGRTFRNLSDGSEGTIVANSERSIEVGSLSGGTTNRFTVGDQCAVLGTGVAAFVFQEAPWGERLVGDDDLSPYPGFTDKAISDVFFHAGRLGFTSEDRVVLSAVGDPYRLWRRTVTQVLDDDPIDIQSAHKDVGVLDSAVEWNGQMLICSSAGHQMSLQGDPSLTPATVRLEALTSYPVADKVRPLVVGGSLLLPSAAGGYSRVREVFRTEDGGFDSRLLTRHVPKYLQGNVIDCSGDADLGMMVFLTDDDRHDLFILNVLHDGEEEHLAWHKWTFGGPVVGAHLVGGYLYLVVYRDTAVKLERINVATPDLSADHRDLGTEGYTFKVRLNRHYLRDRKDQPLTHGRTQVRTVDIHHQDSAYFRVEVVPADRDTKQYEVTTASGRKRVPVLARNDAVTIDIIDNQADGCGISSIGWESTYGDRSRG